MEIIDDKPVDEEKSTSNEDSSLFNGVGDENESSCVTFSLNEPEQLNKILKGMKVILEKSTEIDELVKNSFNQLNGDISD